MANKQRQGAWALSEEDEFETSQEPKEHEALLTTQNYSRFADCGKDVGPSTRAREKSRSVYCYAFLLFASLALLGTQAIVVATMFRTPDATPSDSPSIRIKKNDYMLEPDWNFDAGPMRREYHWTISERRLSPDGVARPMTVINGMFPGPLIEVNEGDTIVAHVNNQAKNATAIHWHGLYQNGTNFMDGTVGITQCPIGPGSNFTYEFKVERQSGTYYYHGHHGAQASDGLVGPLVVHSKDEKAMRKRQDIVSDRVIMVQDHYHDLTGALLVKYLASDRENIEPVPDGALINGQNLRNCSKISNRTCDATRALRPTFSLQRDGNHRLRFLNVGAFAEFQISIDEHSFDVIEADGTELVPASVHRLNINPGQRYSVMLGANTSKPYKTFWLRARMITHCFKEENVNMEETVLGVVEYINDARPASRAVLIEPTSQNWDDAIEVECKDMNSSELVPLHPVQAPAATAFYYIYSNFEIGNWRLSRGFFNKTSWRPDVHNPLLSSSINGLTDSNGTFSAPAKASMGSFVNDKAFNESRNLVIQTDGIQVIDLLIQNLDDGTHPMHLHGHKYFVLASGNGFFNASAVYPTLDLKNPLRRDTATLKAYSWMLIRFVADNPGVWAFHCHLAWHLEAGLLMSFLERADMVKDMTIPQANQRLCSAKGLEKGLGPKDDLWFGNTGG